MWRLGLSMPSFGMGIGGCNTSSELLELSAAFDPKDYSHPKAQSETQESCA